MGKPQGKDTWKLWLYAVIAFIFLGSVVGDLTGGNGPSVTDLRNQGYTDCRKIQNSFAAQTDTSGDIKCIQNGELIAFKDSPYHVNVGG